MPTPVSNATSYCSAAEFLKRYDVRSVGDLVSDDGTRITGSTAILASGILESVLADASGAVESACLVGEKYNPTSLSALTGNSAALLKRIVADLAYGMLRMRRGHKEDTPMPGYEMALEWLNRLRLGERIFGLQENMDAGKPDNVPVTESVLERLRLSTFQASRYFGVRANRNM